MDKLQFEIGIKDAATDKIKELQKMLENISKTYTISVNTDVSSINSLVSSMDKLGTHMGDVQEKMRGFEKTPTFDRLFASLDTVENKFKGVVKKMSDAGASSIQPNALRIEMEASLKELNARFGAAMQEATTLNADGLDKFRNMLQQRVQAIQQVLGDAASNKFITNNFQIVKAFKNLAEQVSAQLNPEAIIKNPFAGVVADTTAVAGAITSAFSNVQRSLIDLRASLEGVGFDHLAGAADRAETAMVKLNEAFKNLTVTMGSNQELKNFMTGLGEVINNVRRVLPESGASGNTSLDQMAKNVKRNSETIDAYLFKIRTTITSLDSAIQAGTANGLPKDRLDLMKSYVTHLREMQAMLKGAKGDTAFLSQSGAVGTLITPANFNTQMGMIKSLMTAVEQWEKFAQKVAKDRDALTDMRNRINEVMQANDKGGGAPWVATLTRELQHANRSLAEYARKIKDLENQGDVKGASKVLGQGWDAEYNKVIQQSLILIENTKAYNNMLTGTEAMLNRITAILSNSSAIDGVDKARGLESQGKIQEFADKLLSLTEAERANEQYMRQLVSEYQQLERQANSAANAQERLNRTQTAKNQAKDEKDAKKLADDMNKARVESAKLEQKVKELEGLLDRIRSHNAGTQFGLTVNPAELEAAINKLRQYQMEIANFAATGKNPLSADKRTQMAVDMVGIDAQANKSKTELAEATRKEAAAQREANKAKNEASSATAKLTQEQQKLVSAIQQANNTAQNQNRILGDLKSMAMQYMSVYSMYGFGKEMANITGELELQKKSLEVVLGNASMASQMYGQIRDLSQMSPFTFMDLMKSTRQLAAFGIETKDLYATMKSLSDIGAGLNVDVNRLILAYGHTRSYGYLSGIQNRQFENAGIDMIGGLADKYNKAADAAKRLGQEAQYVSRRDIFKKMRDKSIPFEDVEAVIMDLDKPGGKFYNMQLRQFDTLGGKLRNLANNYNIMMSELGQKHHGVLMGMVEALTEVHEHWYRYERVIYGVVAALGVMKAAQLAAGKALLATNAQIRSTAQLNAMNKASTSYLNGGGGFWGSANLYNRYDNFARGADIRAIAQNKDISDYTKQRIALTGQLTKKQRQYLLVQSGVNAAQAKSIANYNFLLRGALSLNLALSRLVMTMGRLLASFVMNPMTWVMGAVAGFVAWNQKMKEASEHAKNIRDAIGDAMDTDIKGINEALNGYKTIYTETKTALKNTDGILSSKVTLAPDAFSDRDAADVIEDLRQKLEAQSPIYTQDLFDIMKFEEQAKQVEALIQKMRDIETVKRVEDADKDNFRNIIAGTGGWFNEGVIRNMTDYGEAVTKMSIPDVVWDRLSENGKKQIDDYIDKLGVSREDALKRIIASGRYSWEDLFDWSAASKNSGFKKVFNNIKDAFGTAWKDMQSPAEETAALISSAIPDDPSMQITLISDRLNQMFAEAKIGDENTRTTLSAKFVELIASALDGVSGEKLVEQYATSLISAQLIANIDSVVNSKTNADSLPKIINEQISLAAASVAKKNPTLKAKIEKAMKENMDALRNVAKNEAKKLTITEDWQRRAQDEYKISVTPSIDVDYTDFWNKQRKAIKEVQDKFNSAAKQRVKAKLGMDIELDLNTKSFEAAIRKLKDMYTALGKKNAEIMKDATLTTAQKNAKIRANSALRQDLKSYWEPLEDALKKGKGLDAEGLSWDDPTKNKNKNQGNHRDEEYDKWNRRLNYIKQAYQAYKKWKEEVGDDDGKAMKLVMNRFGEYLSKDDIQNLKDYQKLLENLKKEVLNDNKFKNKENQKNIAASLENLISDTEINDLKDQSKKYESAVKNVLDNIIERFTNYREVLDATGDVDVAGAVLGTQFEWQNKAEAIQATIDEILEKAGILGKVKIGPEMDNEAIRREVQMAVESVTGSGDLNQEMAEQIDAIVSALQKMRDIQKETVKESLKEYSEMMKSMTAYASQVARINKEYQDAVNAAKLLNDPIQRQRMIDTAGRKRYQQLMEISPTFLNFKTNPLTTALDDANRAFDEASTQYRKQFEAGIISADEYTTKIKELSEAMKNIDKGAVDEWVLFLEGGMKAVRAQRIASLEETVRSNRRQEEYARSNGLIKFAETYKANADKAQQQINEYNEDQNDADDLERGVAAVIKGLQKFVQGLNFVTSVMDSLGWGDSRTGENLKNAASVGNSMISGAQALSFLGPYGQIAGAALGLVSGVAQVHDKNLEKQISDLKEDVAKIESYTETMKTSRERTLGYGADISRMRNYWNGTPDYRIRNVDIGGMMFENQKVNSAAVKAMREYYAGISASGSTYQAEYDLLMQKREKYIEMYDKENAKKNSSEEQLEEYKKQIAELDDQLAYFAEDIAKELWGIDVKGWADQLSDALATAWENGTSMAVAYGDTVREILQSVGKEMLSMGIIQPMMETLRTGLFGDENTKGIFDINNVEGSMPKVMDYIAKFFGDGGLGQQTVTATTEFMDGWEEMLNQMGLSAKNMSGSTLSSGIQGMSESTADLLGGYMNAMRQDVSVIRILQQEFFTKYWNDYFASCTSAHQSLANIEQDVAVMRRVQSDIARTVDDFYAKFSRVVQGTEVIHIN